MAEPAPPSDRPREMLTEFLAFQDVECPGCAYNLRALTEPRCPECNQALKLQVALVEPRLGAFICGLVGIAMGLGFSALLLGYGVLHWNNMRGAGEFFAPVTAGTLVGVVLLTLWLPMRRWITRRNAPQRWLLAAAVGVVATLCPIWFILSVR